MTTPTPRTEDFVPNSKGVSLVGCHADGSPFYAQAECPKCGERLTLHLAAASAKEFRKDEWRAAFSPEGAVSLFPSIIHREENGKNCHGHFWVVNGEVKKPYVGYTSPKGGTATVLLDDWRENSAAAQRAERALQIMQKIENAETRNIAEVEAAVEEIKVLWKQDKAQSKAVYGSGRLHTQYLAIDSAHGIVASCYERAMEYVSPCNYYKSYSANGEIQRVN